MSIGGQTSVIGVLMVNVKVIYAGQQQGQTSVIGILMRFMNEHGFPEIRASLCCMKKAPGIPGLSVWCGASPGP